ncbi:MAG: type II toxin-antitoxin system RelE family toxin [Candidatus Limnocylindria bacterium]
MPAHLVEVQRSARRDVERLPAATRSRIAARVDRLARRPRPPGCEKLVGLDAFRLRIDDYRLIYEVDDARRAVIVIRARHRREVYRKLR